MNNLPIEILHNIFIQVPFEERRKWMLVCRYWYNLLSKRSLLYDIDIKTNKQFATFISMLQRMPRLASQVEILQLDITHTFDKRILYNMLPNLRVFRYLATYKAHFGHHHDRHPFKRIHPGSKLVIIEDKDECELTRQLLVFGSCGRLRHLKLELSHMKNPRKEVFIHLKGAPALKRLTLISCDFGIEDGEIIHSGISGLEDLQLEHINLIAGTLPVNIIPATSVTTSIILVDKIKDYPIYYDWYKYLSEKYTKLARFNYSEKQLNNMDPRRKMEIYRDGIFPIYKRLGLSLPKFSATNVPTELNPFNAFDQCDFRVPIFELSNNETRPLFEQLAISNQSKYVELLHLSNTAIASPMMLQNFTSLRELRIDVGRPRWNVCLNHYFNAFPQTLTYFHAAFRTADFNELPLHSNNVKVLDLSCSILCPKLGEVISNCFPKLKSLSLRGHITESINIHLPDHHFTRLSMDFDGETSHGYAITNNMWPETKHYITKGKRNIIRPATSQEIDDRIIVGLAYAEAKYLQCGKLTLGSPL